MSEAMVPIYLRLAGRRCLVVGGGEIALRRARTLAEAGARVRVVAPDVRTELHDVAGVEVTRAAYNPEMLAGVELVFACTDRRAVNAAVAADARRAGTWCNAADQPDDCDFFMPAVVRRGRLSVAVGTGGAAPALSSAVRKRLDAWLDPDYERLSAVLAEARLRLKDAIDSPSQRHALQARLCEDDSMSRLVREGEAAWWAWFDQLVAQADAAPRRSSPPEPPA